MLIERTRRARAARRRHRARGRALESGLLPPLPLQARAAGRGARRGRPDARELPRAPHGGGAEPGGAGARVAARHARAGAPPRAAPRPRVRSCWRARGSPSRYPAEVAASEPQLTALVRDAIRARRATPASCPHADPERDAETLYHQAMGWLQARLAGAEASRSARRRAARRFRAARPAARRAAAARQRASLTRGARDPLHRRRRPGRAARRAGARARRRARGAPRDAARHLRRHHARRQHRRDARRRRRADRHAADRVARLVGAGACTTSSSRRCARKLRPGARRRGERAALPGARSTARAHARLRGAGDGALAAELGSPLAGAWCCSAPSRASPASSALDVARRTAMRASRAALPPAARRARTSSALRAGFELRAAGAAPAWPRRRRARERDRAQRAAPSRSRSSAARAASSASPPARRACCACRGAQRARRPLPRAAAGLHRLRRCLLVCPDFCFEVYRYDGRSAGAAP